MKKICALLAVALLLTAGTALADNITAGQVIAATSSAGTGSQVTNGFAKLSGGVSLAYKTSTASYAIETKHVNGDKMYGAAANDGKTYMFDGATVGAAATDVSVSDSTAFTGTGWTTL